MSGQKRRRGWLQRGVITMNCTAIALALGAAYLVRTSYGRIESIDRVELTGSLTPREAAGQSGSRVLNFLLVGSDSAAALDADDPINNERGGERNGDVIIIAHVDERSGSAAMLSIPRDLWVPIAGTDREAKINSAFAVGGPALLIDTIEENFDIPIHHYVNVDFAGFQGLVDALGAVDIWFEQPARDFNPAVGASQTGFAVTERGCRSLDGRQALAYVRSRYYQTLDDDGNWVSQQASDLNRIRRQQEFLRQIAAQAINRGSRNPFVFNGLVDAAVQYVTLDDGLTPSLLLDLGAAFDDFDSAGLQAYSLPGEFGWVGSTSVLFLQEEPARPILELFRGRAFDDPGTVAVEVIHEPSAERQARAEELVASLSEAGFDGVSALPAPVEPPGTEIRFGDSSLQAAQLVQRFVAGTPPLVAADGLTGRSVIVAIGPDERPVPGDEDPGTSVPTVPDSADDEAATPSTAPADDSDAPVTSEVGDAEGLTASTCGR